MVKISDGGKRKISETMDYLLVRGNGNKCGMYKKREGGIIMSKKQLAENLAVVVMRLEKNWQRNLTLDFMIVIC